jgi:hypothetical protein
MTPTDRTLLRDLARRVADVAADPIQDERRALWRAQNSLRSVRPVIFISPEGSWIELVPEASLQCQDDDARGIERGLRQRLYAQEHFHDDTVCDADYRIGKALRGTGWGVGETITRPEEARGAYVWEGAIKTRADLEALTPPTVTVDEEASARNLAYYQDLFGDLLHVYFHNPCGGYALMDEWTRLRGITQTLMDMSDDPQLVHDGMRTLMEGHLARTESMLQQGITGLNNGNDYVGSGSWGWSDELPQADFAGTARLADMWGFCTAQIMSEVSPAMHEEFVIRYEAPLAERFGLNIYGCCEPLHRKLDLLKRHLPRLRRVSISPWADKAMSAEQLGDQIIFNWKPNPAVLAGVGFDEDWARSDIRETIDICRANGCPLDIVMKDTHTCQQQPQRFDRWAEIAREEVEKA